jgi:cytidylate kinase
MENKNIVIGIEGLVGSGKTSICRKMLENDKKAILLNGGNLYRAIVYALMQKENNLFKLRKKMKNIDIKQCMDESNVEMKIENRESTIYINGKLADENELQSKASSLAVSLIGGIADNNNLFKYAKEIINELKKTNNVIVSGRALMQIYPELDYHFFITAKYKERIKRKSIQYNEKKSVGINIALRDLLQKMAGFYKIYLNTTKIDVTECKNVEESTKKVETYIK